NGPAENFTMPQTIKVGVVTQAEGAHLPDYFLSLARAEEVESVTLADASARIEAIARRELANKLTDTYKDAKTRVKQGHPQMTFASLESVLAPPAIDTALDAGSHAVAEKPSCVRATDMERLVKKAQIKHGPLMPAIPNRLHAPVREARRLVQEG